MFISVLKCSTFHMSHLSRVQVCDVFVRWFEAAMFVANDSVKHFSKHLQQVMITLSTLWHGYF